MPDSNKTKALFIAFLVATTIGLVAGHVIYDSAAKAEFRERATAAGYTAPQIQQWLTSGMVTVDESAGRMIGMGHPINYGTFDHCEYLIYGVLGGVTLGFLVVIGATVADRKTAIPQPIGASSQHSQTLR